MERWSALLVTLIHPHPPTGAGRWDQAAGAAGALCPFPQVTDSPPPAEGPGLGQGNGNSQFPGGTGKCFLFPLAHHETETEFRAQPL